MPIMDENQFEHGRIPLRPLPLTKRNIATTGEFIIDYIDQDGRPGTANYHMFITDPNDRTKIIDLTQKMLQEIYPNASINANNFNITIEGIESPYVLRTLLSFIYKRFILIENPNGFIYDQDIDKVNDPLTKKVLLKNTDNTYLLPVTTTDNVFDANGVSVQERLNNISRIAMSVLYLKSTEDNQTEFDFEYPYENYSDFMEIRIGTVYVDKTRYSVNPYYNDNGDYINGKITFYEGIEKDRRIDLIFTYNSYNPAGKSYECIMSGSSIAAASISTSKLERVTDKYDLPDSTTIPSSKALYSLYTKVKDAAITINENNSNLIDTINENNNNLVDEIRIKVNGYLSSLLSNVNNKLSIDYNNIADLYNKFNRHIETQNNYLEEKLNLVNSYMERISLAFKKCFDAHDYVNDDDMYYKFNVYDISETENDSYIYINIPLRHEGLRLEDIMNNDNALLDINVILTHNKKLNNDNQYYTIYLTITDQSEVFRNTLKIYLTESDKFTSDLYNKDILSFTINGLYLRMLYNNQIELENRKIILSNNPINISFINFTNRDSISYTPISIDDNTPITVPGIEIENDITIDNNTLINIPEPELLDPDSILADQRVRVAHRCQDYEDTIIFKNFKYNKEYPINLYRNGVRLFENIDYNIKVYRTTNEDGTPIVENQEEQTQVPEYEAIKIELYQRTEFEELIILEAVSIKNETQEESNNGD